MSGLNFFKPPLLNPLVKCCPTVPRAHPNSPLKVLF